MRFLKESLLTQASAVSIGALLLMGACAPVSEDAKEKMAEPINCNTAAEDVATLESEKASVVKRVEMGARYIVPIAAAVDILRSYNSDTETSEEFFTETSEEFFQDKESVLTGDYNAAIDRKIADIKQTCGI
jgi:long-subunit acyl-CoA synthetase (AMP-forming)